MEGAESFVSGSTFQRMVGGPPKHGGAREHSHIRFRQLWCFLFGRTSSMVNGNASDGVFGKTSSMVNGNTSDGVFGKTSSMVNGNASDGVFGKTSSMVNGNASDGVFGKTSSMVNRTEPKASVRLGADANALVRWLGRLPDTLAIGPSRPPHSTDPPAPRRANRCADKLEAKHVASGPPARVAFVRVSTEQLTFNPIDWATWLRLDAITTDARASDAALVAELRSVKRTLREGADIDSIATLHTLPPTLRSGYAVGHFAVDPAQCASVLVELLREAPDDQREDVRQAILELAFTEGGLRWWGSLDLDAPGHLLTAFVPALRDEIAELGRRPPLSGSVVWGLREPEPEELVPRRDDPRSCDALPRVMGLIHPLPAYPRSVVADRAFSPAQVAELAAALPSRIELPAADDREFFAYVDALREGGSDGQTNSARAVQSLLQDAEAIANVLRMSATRGLGLDINYHPRP
jgi:hypothetical protein